DAILLPLLARLDVRPVPPAMRLATEDAELQEGHGHGNHDGFRHDGFSMSRATARDHARAVGASRRRATRYKRRGRPGQDLHRRLPMGVAPRYAVAHAAAPEC